MKNMNKLITIFFAAAMLVCGSLCAQENGHEWVKYEGNPVFGGPEIGTMFDANVIPQGEAKFNMYVSWRPEKAIALTRSNDGVNWSEPVVVLRNDETSGWRMISTGPVLSSGTVSIICGIRVRPGATARSVMRFLMTE